MGKFLANECEIRGEADGVILYGASNCNYLVFPGGEMVENYGYHGQALPDRVRKEGAGTVLRELLLLQRDKVRGILSRP